MLLALCGYFVIYTLMQKYCSISGPMYQPSFMCDSHDTLSFGLGCVADIIPFGTRGYMLYSYSRTGLFMQIYVGGS